MRATVGHLVPGLVAAIGFALSLHALLAPPPEAAQPADTRPPVAVPTAATPVAAALMAEKSAAARAALTDRPLFDSSRRPYMPPAPAPPPPTPSVAAPPPTPAPSPRLPKLAEQGWQLSGTVVGTTGSAEDRIALLRSARGSAIQKVKEGEDFQGWRVVRIEAGRLSLRAGGQEDEMTLPKADTSAVAPSRAATAAPNYAPTPPPRPLPAPQR